MVSFLWGLMLIVKRKKNEYLSIMYSKVRSLLENALKNVQAHNLLKLKE
jgi:hypothetical protein